MDELNRQLESMGYNRLFDEQQLPPTEQRVHELEEVIGLNLPDNYRSFLLEHGSIGPSIPVEVPIPDWDECFAVCYFLGFYRPDPNPNLLRLDLSHVYRAMRHRIGDSILPIATGEGGALVCLSLSPDERRGTIWAWCDLDDAEAWNLFPLADSLASLINNLRPFVDWPNDT